MEVSKGMKKGNGVEKKQVRNQWQQNVPSLVKDLSLQIPHLD
jgi:hypothetical protein